MFLGIITTIFSTLGIYGFFTNNFILLSIGAIAVIIQTLIGIFSGQLRSLGPTIFFIIFGIIFADNILIGIAIGLCFEGTIMFLGGVLLLLTLSKSVPKKEI